MANTQTTLNEQTREGFKAGLFAARYLCPPDRAFICPKCSRAMHRRVFGETGDLPEGGALYGFACNTCHTLLLAEADNCMDAAEKLGGAGMSAPGKPLQDAAGAACRNAAAGIDEAYKHVEQAARAAGITHLVNGALYHMDKACRMLDAAADFYYREEEQR